MLKWHTKKHTRWSEWIKSFISQKNQSKIDENTQNWGGLRVNLPVFDKRFHHMANNVKVPVIYLKV